MKALSTTIVFQAQTEKDNFYLYHQSGWKITLQNRISIMIDSRTSYNQNVAVICNQSKVGSALQSSQPATKIKE